MSPNELTKKRKKSINIEMTHLSHAQSERIVVRLLACLPVTDIEEMAKGYQKVWALLVSCKMAAENSSQYQTEPRNFWIAKRQCYTGVVQQRCRPQMRAAHGTAQKRTGTHWDLQSMRT